MQSMKAIVKSNRIGDNGCFMPTNSTHPLAHYFSCCSPLYEDEKEYTTDVYAYHTLVNGELMLTVGVRVYDGSVDGYDSPCGMYYCSFDEANEDFEFFEE